jgi:hypothetical protein
VFTALLCIAAPTGAREGAVRIEWGGIDLVVPADSPARPLATDRDRGFVEFDGRFVISGPYSIECDELLDEPCTRDNVVLFIEPDATLFERLPKWENGGDKPLIAITHATGFIEANLDSSTLEQLQSGSIMRKTGHASFVVENFATGLDCEAAWYSARLVSFGSVASADDRTPQGTTGCG